ncbi:hypothetical protein [Bacillus marinisedimentorum]|uniref:hypothetical protein n=1 Tax=Bacillus marinisedimentorum TaxID=1821260 RepID=UPI0007E11AA2|nr:hypothetical protein [Bacillus marinisedimentorum]
MQQKSKGLTFFLSFVPGLGHFYLGLMNRGLQIMIAFFSVMFLSDLFHLFGFLMPVIWFFGLFDALQQHRLVTTEDGHPDRPFIEWGHLHERKDLLGWGLIVFGILLILDKLTIYFFNMPLFIMMRNALVGVLLIVLGWYLIKGRGGSSGHETESGRAESSLESPAFQDDGVREPADEPEDKDAPDADWKEGELK